MTNPGQTADSAKMQPAPISRRALLVAAAKAVPVILLLVVVYRVPVAVMHRTWNLVDSYYSHGFLIPPISLFLVWLRREALLRARVRPSLWGYPFLLCAALLLVLGAFLGFTVFGQFSLIPMIVGLVLVLLGPEHLKIMWFPIAFLLFMIPIPPALTQSISLNLKLLATECAIGVARALTFPMVREGSFVYFKQDSLLIGEVCGGLRSLISLLAIGALMAYFSKSRPWARILILILSGPIAIVANVFRILVLCVVGYFWGSAVASGTFHDVSGFFIYGVAFILFFLLEAGLRKLAPARTAEEGAQ